MDDLISRQETIKAALEYQVEYCGAAFDIRMQEGMIKKLKDIPSAEKRGEWIPVSERLPKDNKTKIVQIKGINEVEAGYYSNGDWWCINSAGTLSILEVVAWMELPEPYTGKLN